MKQLLVLFILLTPFSSHAVKWVERGNGGFVLKCDNSESHQVFDIYEAQQRYQVLDQAHLGSVDERVRYLISKIAKLNPSRAALYLTWYDSFMEESLFLANVELSPVPDVGLGIKPKNCTLELAVFQREPDPINSKRYVISLDLWNSLDTLNQAALIMHEITYRELIEIGSVHQTSESTRYFNGAIHSQNFTTLSTRDYLNLLQNLFFPSADYHGYTVRLMTSLDNVHWKPAVLRFHKNGNIHEARLASEGPLEAGNRVYMKCITWDATIRFYDDGTIANISSIPDRSHECETKYTYQDGNTQIEFFAQNWFFDSSGHLFEISGDVNFYRNPTAIVFKGVQATADRISKHDYFKVAIRLNQQGQLTEFNIAAVSEICISKDATKIKFNPDRATASLVLKTETIQKDLAQLPHCRVPTNKK